MLIHTNYFSFSHKNAKLYSFWFIQKNYKTSSNKVLDETLLCIVLRCESKIHLHGNYLWNSVKYSYFEKKVLKKGNALKWNIFRLGLRPKITVSIFSQSNFAHQNLSIQIENWHPLCEIAVKNRKQFINL